MCDMLRIAGIVEESIVDGPGIRLVVFTQGCNHLCKDCQNEHTHSFDGGKLVTIESIIDKIKEDPLLDGITLSGGEPFEQAYILSILAKKVKDLGHNVMTYTGYKYEYLEANSSKTNAWQKLLDNTDILVDGKFDIDKKDLKLRFRGSTNQRVIDVQKTRIQKEIVIADI